MRGCDGTISGMIWSDTYSKFLATVLRHSASRLTFYICVGWGFMRGCDGMALVG